MKYDININQRVIIEGGFGIDIVEAAIMDHCRCFSASSACQFKLENGNRYYWFEHKNICKQLPILGLKPDSAYRRMKKLCEKKFLSAHPQNRKLNTSWYAFGELADALVSTIGRKSEPSENYPKGGAATIGKLSEPSDENPKVAPQPSDENPKAIGKLSEGPSDENPMYKNIIEKENNIIPTATASSAGAKGEVDSVVDPLTLEAEQPPPTPPDSARPPASPKIEKKVYGDGDLQKMVRHYARNNPDQYEVNMYTEFLEHYTEVVINSSNPAEVGKELWRTHKTFPIKKLLETWLPGYLRDKQKAQQQHESATRSTTNPGAGQGRSGGPKSSHSKPVKRTPIITPDMLRRDGRPDRNARPDGDRRTIVLDVDPGREPDPAGTDRGRK